MKTDKLWVNGNIRRNNEVNEILQDFAGKLGITGRDYRHMELLTEETLGMAAQMLKHFDGEIWLESTPSGYQIILEAEVQEEGRYLPTTPATDGFMGKIAEMLNCSYVFRDISEMPDNLQAALPDYMSYGMRTGGKGPAWAGEWALSAYRQNVRNTSEKEIRLDELEKSIVASLASDVTIGIHGRRIRLVISG